MKYITLCKSITVCVLCIAITGVGIVGVSASWAGQRGVEFEKWLGDFKEEAIAQGVKRRTVENNLNNIVLLEKVVELDRAQPEFVSTFWAYFNRRINSSFVKSGRSLLYKHQVLLDKIHAGYGVPPRILVALWGIETNYGGYQGKYSVIDALATLAYEGRRSELFRSELMTALRLLDLGYCDGIELEGSWAGAMGNMQFMPSVYLQYGVDATGDGRKDLWNSLPDALSSGANYLQSLGWRPGETWGREVVLPAEFDWRLTRKDHIKPVRYWASMGVLKADGSELPNSSIMGRIVLPQGRHGPAFLVYGNFNVLLSWNRSDNFALTVGLLADQLIGLPGVINGQAVKSDVLTFEQVLVMQALLKSYGYYPYEPDGIPGSGTKAAVMAFQESVGLPADGYPSLGVLDKLKAMRENN